MMGKGASEYGWIPEVEGGKRSPAELYGWVPPRRNGTRSGDVNGSTESCVQCGSEFSVQRTGAVYECDRCIGRRD